MDENSINNSKLNTKVIPKTQKKKKVDNITFEQEILRKGIHLVSLNIPVIYIFVTREFALWVLGILMLLAVGIDIASKYDNFVRDFLFRYFGKMLRHHEKNRDLLILNGASWVLIASFVTVFIFPKIIAIMALMILIISDISAALIGRRYGKNKIWNKSVEGTMAFIISAMLVVFLLGNFFRANQCFFVSGFVASIVGGFVELVSTKIKIDDNISIPMSIGIVMLLANYIADKLFNCAFINIL